ncbi:MAG: hypothetical protein JXA28_03780 [Bacteroidetes bacterium]|nr:hypothetical protein [Bacteroidota bacterium]
MMRSTGGKSVAARMALFVALLMLCTVPLRAQVECEFSGYVVDLPVYQSFRSELADAFRLDAGMGVNLTRLRLRPTLRLWDGAGISVEHETDVSAMTQSMLFGEISDITNRQVVDLRWHPVAEEHVQVQHYIDRLYFRQNFTRGSIIAGRQRISWGSGRIWNPTDLFNPINPASFDKIEKDGADALSAKYYIGSFTDVQLVYNPRRARLQAEGQGDAPDSSNYGARFRTNFAEFDVSVMGGRFDRRTILGGDFAGNLLEAGVRGELIHAMESADGAGDAYTRFILGVDYQLTAKLYGVVEYLHNGEGAEDPRDYELGRLFTGEILNVARDYVYLGGTYLLHPLVTGSLGAIAGLTDGSGFVTATATWSSSDNSVISLGALIPYGSRLDEYWYYPSSVYLKGEFYF